MEEVWKQIEKCKDGFAVSNLGRIKNLKTGTIYKLFIEKHGYVSITLIEAETGKTKLMRIHRLVAEAFIENPKNYRCVNHIDGNKQNNRVDNLEWCTHSENSKHFFSLVREGSLSRSSPSKKRKRLDKRIKTKAVFPDGTTKTYSTRQDLMIDLSMRGRIVASLIRTKKPWKGILFENA